ncbi:MAG: hypothetical protein NVS4B1_30390 [Ktedonobacteraceae bacterium]
MEVSKEKYNSERTANTRASSAQLRVFTCWLSWERTDTLEEMPYRDIGGEKKSMF